MPRIGVENRVQAVQSLPGGLVGAVGRVSLGRVPMRRGGVKKALKLLHGGFVHVRRAAKKCNRPRIASCNHGRVPTYEYTEGFLCCK